MKQNISINFYSIDKCGYYLHGSKSPSFGSITSILEDIKTWSENRAIIDTSILHLLNKKKTSSKKTSVLSLLPIYLHSLHKQENDWLLTTWNELPTSLSGSVPSIEATSTVGAPTVHQNTVKTGTIPGYPTFFWFIPDKKLFACVKLGAHLFTGQPMMRLYIEQALKNQISRHTDYTDLGNGQIISNKYLADPNIEQNEEEEEDFFYPAFKTSQKRKKSPIAKILNNANKIIKIESKDTLRDSNPDEMSILSKVLAFWNLEQEPRAENFTRVNFRYELNPRVVFPNFGKKEAQQIISQWENANVDAGRNDNNDYAFHIKGEPSPIWLSSSICSHKDEIELEQDENEQINSVHLLKVLLEKKNEILKAMQ